MLADRRNRCDGLQLNFSDDVSLDEELNICTWMVGRPENLGGKLSPVCVYAMNIKQLVVDAFDVRSDTPQLPRVQCSNIRGEFANIRITQGVRRPPQRIKHQPLFNRPEAGAVINQPLQRDCNNNSGAALSVAYCGAAKAEIAILPISVLQ